MNGTVHLVVFTFDGQRYALHLDTVERVLPAVEITPLPKAPQIVPGVINVRGELIPVVNARKRFQLPERELEPSDRFIIALASRRKVALFVDEVSGVVESSESDVVAAGKILPRLEYLQGVVKLDDGMILIHDLDRFLSLEEEAELNRAVKAHGGPEDGARRT